MTPDQLREIGEALYGTGWQSDLAADLGVAERTVRRWLSGAQIIPDGVAAEVRALCVRRGTYLRTLAATG